MRLAAVVLAALAGWCLPLGTRGRLRRLPRKEVATRAGSGGALSWKRRGVRRWRSRHAARKRRGEVVELCQALAAELEAGAPPRVALVAAAEGLATFDQLATVAESTYGDVSTVLTSLARAPGCEGLARVAACWRLCERSGVGLSVAVGRRADALRDDEQVRRETAAQVAGPRATGVMLALLPLFGLGMGSALGAAPLRLLFHTPAGLLLVGSAAVLEVLGLVWMSRITRRVLPP